jgi:hypothetical protein
MAESLKIGLIPKQTAAVVRRADEFLFLDGGFAQVPLFRPLSLTKHQRLYLGYLLSLNQRDQNPSHQGLS